MSGLQDAGLLLPFYFHVLTTMHGQNHIKLIKLITNHEMTPKEMCFRVQAKQLGLVH